MTLTEKRVDPRVKRTRQLLQRAFLELLAEKEMASISIQDITDRATVNRATFYAHFPDKYALLDSIVRELFQQMLGQHLPPARSGTCRACVRWSKQHSASWASFITNVNMVIVNSIR
jgi:AcrR family transcriptional regulator